MQEKLEKYIFFVFIGVCGQQDDEDELDEDSNSKSKRDRHESSNSKMDSFVIVDDSNSELKKSSKNNENSHISDSVVVTTTTAAVNVTHQNNVQQRTRLPSFSSIIAGTYHSVLVGHKRAKKLSELIVWIFLFR